MLALFLIAAFLVFYVFIGYPLLVILLAALRTKSIKKGDYEPTVSLIISAYNEAEIIREKIANSCALTYPKEKLEIIVADDGSTDSTDLIVKEYGDNVRLLRIEGRLGKVECQNQGAAAATGDVLVFSDANSIYDENALAELMRNLHDDSVGVVCGELRYVRKEGSDEGLYWKLEKALKRAESALGSCLGANGAMYAIRRTLYRALPPESCSDFIEPFAAYEQGYRVVYEPKAFCVETPGDNALEFMRKQRIVLNSFQSIYLIKTFLNPLRYGWYSLALWSHKILRWYAFLFLALVFVTNLFLLDLLLFQLLLVLQLAFYVCALIGVVSTRKLFSVPYYFIAVNIASLLAFIDFVVGKKITAWEKVR